MQHHLTLALLLLIGSHLAQSMYIDTSSGPSTSCLLQADETSCIQQGCEWAQTHCEVTCESLTKDSICLLFDKCKWTPSSQCTSRGTLCYQLESQEACERKSDCVWSGNERACVKAEEGESIPIDPSADICAFMIMESTCNLYEECTWNGVQCITKSETGEEEATEEESVSPSISPSISPVKDETQVMITPTFPPSAQREMYCYNDSSRQACESSSISGFTCVFSAGKCRAVHDRLMPASTTSILDPYALVWISANVVFSAGILPIVVMIRGAMKKRMEHPEKQTRVLRLIQANLAIGAVTLFAVKERPTNVIVPLFVSSASVAIAVSFGIANMAHQPGMDSAMYMVAIVVAASISKTSTDTVLAGSIVLTVACVILPAFIYGDFQVKQQLDSILINSNAIIGTRVLGMAFALSILVMSSSTPIVVSAAWISGIVVLTIQLVLFGLCAFSIPFSWIPFTLDVISCITALVGSIEANYTNSNLAIAIVTVLLVGVHAFATITAALHLLLPSAAPQQQKHVFKSSNGPGRAPAKQKVFATPASAPVVESPPKSKPSPIAVRFDPESFLGMVYLESRSLENSLNSQNQSLSPRRRTSSADYKREMAIV